MRCHVGVVAALLAWCVTPDAAAQTVEEPGVPPAEEVQPAPEVPGVPPTEEVQSAPSSAAVGAESAAAGPTQETATAAQVLPPMEDSRVLSGEALRRVPSQTLEEGLLGHLPVYYSASFTGVPGADLALRLRGIPLASMDAPPLYVVDGVPLVDATLPGGFDGSSVGDLSPYDIERIEVLPGPSAAARFGSRGAGGAVLIKTRRGQVGLLQANVIQRVGFSQLSRKLGSRTFATVEEAVAVYGEGAREHFRPGTTFDHEQLLAGRQDLALETLAELSVGGGGTRLSVSGLVNEDPGIVTRTGYGKQGLRLAFDQKLGPSVQVSATAHLLHTQARKGMSGDGVSPYMVLASTPSFWDPSASEDGTYPDNPFLPTQPNPLETAALLTNQEDVLRAIASVRLGVTLLSAGPHELALGLTAGLNGARQNGLMEFPAELSAGASVEPADGTRLSTIGDQRSVSGQLELRHEYRSPSRALTLQSAVGLEIADHLRDVLYRVSRMPATGGAGSGGDTVATEQMRTRVSERALVLRSSGLLFGEHLLLDAAIRAEQSSLSGAPDSIQLDPMVSVAYRVLTGAGLVDEVRPRVAYGAVSRGPAQNLERRSEAELGVDVVTLGGRATLGLRGYEQTARDFLSFHPAPSPGPSVPLFIPGTMESRGVEASLSAVPLRWSAGEWTSRTLLGLCRSHVVSLPAGSVHASGIGTRFGVVRLEEGASATQVLGYDGLRADGTCCDVNVLGDMEPSFRMSFQNEVRVGGFSLWMLLDWQQGGTVMNLARSLQDFSQNSPDFEPEGRERLAQFATRTAVYLEDASFLKVREVAVGYTLPASWYRGLLPAVGSVQLSLSARNLWTLTGYTGLEPQQSSHSFSPAELVPSYPPSRSFWTSLEVGF